MKKNKPEFHRVLEATQLVGKHGKSMIRYVLRYNESLFKGAACQGIDTDVFYPAQDVFSPDEERMITRMCHDCPAMMACLEWGLAHERHGVWGGTTPNMRNKIRNNIGWMVTEPKM